MFPVLVIVATLLVVTIGYAMILRPILHRTPLFREFYAEADGFWSTVWAYCGKSVTIAWSYVLGGIGLAFSALDLLGPMLGDPDLNLQQTVVDALKDHPQAAGYVVFGFGLITLVTRLRSLLT